jgi:thiamine-monophosphate kinase
VHPASPTVATLGERALIARIEATLPPAPDSVVVGLGDDAAVVRPERGTLTVLTTDALVDGVHFDRVFTPPSDIGHKAVAVSLSDLAAMGATPQQVLLSLALPPDLPVTDLDAIVEGVVTLGVKHHTTLVGGNIARSSGPLFVEVAACGSVKERRILTRTGARPGDALYLSGSTGGAGAGLASLRDRPEPDGPAEDADGLTAVRRRYLRPEPRVRLGTLLGRNRVTRACVDLSDGLADAAHQLARASRVGLVIDADTVPVQPEARQWWNRQGADPLDASFTAGEDYELLFTVSPRATRTLTAVRRLVKGLPLTRIGEVTRSRDVVLRRDGRDLPLPEGFEHFT